MYEKNVRQTTAFLIIILSIILRGSLPLYMAELIIVFLLFVKLTVNLIKGKVYFDKKDSFVIMWVLAYITVILLSGFYLRNDSEWLTYIVYFLIGLIIYYVIIQYIKSKEDLIRFIKLYIIVVLVEAINTIFFHLIYLIFGYRSMFVHVGATVRSIGFYGNPNYYSVSLLLALGLLMGVFSFGYLSSKSNRKYVYFTVAYLILMIGIYFTYSRGALIAAVFTSLLFFIYNFRQILNLRIIAISFILVLLVLVWYQNSDKIVLTTISEQTIQRIENALFGTGAGRYLIWSNGWELYTSDIKFLLFGVGGNQFIFYEEYGIPNHVHNGYLRFLYESGAVGFSLFIVLLIKLLKSTFNFSNMRPSSLLFYSLIIISVMSLSNDMFIIKEFWLLVGLIAVWKKFSEQKLAAK